MTQRMFDVNNEKDMTDLWDILPDNILRIYTEQIECFDRPRTMIEYLDTQKDFFPGFIAINWHDKTEITRPIEATEVDVGKLCKFWTGKNYAIGILKEIDNSSDIVVYGMEDGKNGSWFIHCRRLTKQEIEGLC